jgi:hypothetical protein
MPSSTASCTPSCTSSPPNKEAQAKEAKATNKEAQATKATEAVGTALYLDLSDPEFKCEPRHFWVEGGAVVWQCGDSPVLPQN